MLCGRPKRLLLLAMLTVCAAEPMPAPPTAWQRFHCQDGDSLELRWQGEGIQLRHRQGVEDFAPVLHSSPWLHQNQHSSLYHDGQQLLWLSRPQERLLKRCRR